jgi:hypothetical protein
MRNTTIRIIQKGHLNESYQEDYGISHGHGAGISHEHDSVR